MKFGYNTEQRALQEAVQRFLGETADRDRIRDSMDSGLEFDPVAWARTVDELELTGIAVPVEQGGAGGGTVELTLVLEEYGRVLARSPYLATAGLAVPVLVAAGGAVAERFLPGVAAGTSIATVALPVGGQSMARSPITADGDHRLTGVLETVLNGPSADLIIVAAELDGAQRLFVVEAADTERTAYDESSGYDLTSSLGRITLAGTPGHLLDDATGNLIDLSYALASLSIAAVQVGGAAACLDASVSYAKTRTQFGRAIGSFQAIKHRCADVLLQVESARSILQHAAWLADQGSIDELLRTAPLVKTWCSDTYVQAAEAHLLIHGGIGFTWEHDAHLHVRRAKFLSLLLGSADDHRDLLMSRVLPRKV